MAVDCGWRVADVEGLLCASRSGLWDREYAGREAHPQLDRYLCHRREAALDAGRLRSGSGEADKFTEGG